VCGGGGGVVVVVVVVDVQYNTRLREMYSNVA
jgi:hypothetical protein